jgi:hypothetical protein
MRYIVIIHNPETLESSVWTYPPRHPGTPHTLETARAQADAWNADGGMGGYVATVWTEVEA